MAAPDVLRLGAQTDQDKCASRLVSSSERQDGLGDRTETAEVENGTRRHLGLERLTEFAERTPTNSP